MLEKDLYQLLEGTADAAFAVDGQGVICSWNRAAEKMFGYTAPEVLDKSCAELFQGLGALGTEVCREPCDVLACAAARRQVPNYDLQVKSRSGRRLWVNVSILVHHDDRTGRAVTIHLARDVSPRKQSEELTRRVVDLARQIVGISDDGGRPAPTAPLTAQERKVLHLLSEGKGPAEVARALRITPRTLRNHLHHVNRKLRTKNRLEAVMHALRRGLI